MDVALARCAILPESDPDEALLLCALREGGATADALGWDDPAADFSQAKATILRATWNYPDRPDDFIVWCERVAAVSRLWNPLPAVKWNLHKRYLLELEQAGIPVVPTRHVSRGDPVALSDILGERGWSDVVIKPAISCASRKTIRANRSDLSRGEAHLDALVAEGDALVQPYQPSVDGDGERSIIWIDGELTHAVRKSPRLSDGHESVTGALPIRPAEAELARRAVAAAPQPLLYARVDMAADEHGRPRIMELELIEPSLFLAQSPAGQARIAAPIRSSKDPVFDRPRQELRHRNSAATDQQLTARFVCGGKGRLPW